MGKLMSLLGVSANIDFLFGQNRYSIKQQGVYFQFHLMKDRVKEKAGIAVYKFRLFNKPILNIRSLGNKQSLVDTTNWAWYNEIRI